MLVGILDEREPVAPAILQAWKEDPRVILTGRREDLPSLYSAMDVFVLPSYREGLPGVVLEASAMELPVVATAVTGCVDAVVDGVTGTLVPPRDVPALTQALERYLSDPALRHRHGQEGRAFILRDFGVGEVWNRLLEVYQDVSGSQDSHLSVYPADHV